MTATARVALGPSSGVKDWYMDVNTGTSASPTWTPCSGLMSFKPDLKDVLKDNSTFDGGGAQSSQKTADQWILTGKLKRAGQSDVPTAYDPGQEALRAASLLYGASNQVQVRWYEVNGSGRPVAEAWEGTGAVSWTEDADGYDDVRVAAFTITGAGPKTAVSPNPGSV